MRYFSLICSLFQLIPGILFSQVEKLEPAEMEGSDNYHIISWGTEDGLPQNSVNDVVQTSDGYIWLATYAGLVRFDGVNFKTYQIGDYSGLGSNRIVTLLEADDGKLWIGHENSGVTVFENHSFHTPSGLEAISSEFVMDLCEDIDGNVWIGTSNGLFRYNNGELRKFDVTDGLQGNMINRIFSNPTGGVHFTSNYDNSNGFAFGLLKDNTYELKKKYDNQRNFIILDYNSKDELWTANHDRLEITAADKVLTVCELNYSELRGIRAFLKDTYGDIWLGSNNGLRLIPSGLSSGNEKTNGMIQFDSKALSETIRKVFQDKEGGIWVGTDGFGVSRLKKQAIKKYYPKYETGNQSFDEMAPDGNGGMWFASLCDGLRHYKDGIFSKFKPAGECINALYQDPIDPGNTYVGTGTLLGKIDDFKYSVITDLGDLFPEEEGFHVRITSILKDKEGHLWIGTLRKGIVEFSNELIGHYSMENGLLGDWIHTIKEMNSGEIWIGTDNGINVISSGNVSQITSSNGLVNGAIRCIYEDGTGTIWVGSYGGGLSMISNGEIFNFHIEDGLFENIISRITEDENGNLWMLGNIGLFMINKQQLFDYKNGKIKELNCLPFKSEDGMAEGNGAGNVVTTSDGITWWSTIHGIAGININLDYQNSDPPKVVLQEVIVGGVDHNNGNSLDISTKSRDIEVHYAALNYSSPTKIIYRYLLEGYDEEWKPNGNQRLINYTNLDPGKYQLKIQASYLNGVWGSKTTDFTITIKPRFYEMIWFKVFLVILGFILIWLVFRWRNAYLVAKREELAGVIKERTQELNQKNVSLESQKHELQEALNKLKDAQQRLVQSEKMASLGILSAGVAHEINNPLQFIQNGLDIIRKSEKDRGDLKEKLPLSLEIIESGITRASAIVSSLNQFSRVSDRFDEYFDVKEVLENCLFMVSNRFKSRISVKTILPGESLHCIGNKGKLHQAFLNLLLNAEQAIDKDGEIIIEAKKEKRIIVSIRDNGKGIPQDVKAKIFDPFFTTKLPGEGTGLGLSITFDIISQHHGSIKVDSDLGNGTCFTIYLPVARKSKRTSGE